MPSSMHVLRTRRYKCETTSYRWFYNRVAACEAESRVGGGALARSCNARSCYLLSPAAGEMRGCHCTLQERRSPTGFERNVFFFHTINSIEVTMDFLV